MPRYKRFGSEVYDLSMKNLGLKVPNEPCELCGCRHAPELPHEPSFIYELNFFKERGRKPTIEDMMDHCNEAVKAI